MEIHAEYMKQRILIALLTYRDSVNVSFLSWIENIRRLNSDPNHPRYYEVMYVPGRRPVAYARNVAVARFIKSGADKLWFIDDDLVPTESSLRIFDSEAEIVSGLYYLMFTEDGMRPNIESCIYYKKSDGFSHIDTRRRMIGQDIIPIDAAGTGTLLIDKKIFMDSRMMSPLEYRTADGKSAIHDTADSATYFRTLYKPDASEERSEDLDFVWRAKKLGYRCECVLDARFLHKKEVLIDWFI